MKKMVENASSHIEVKVNKEPASSSQKNIERFKIISGQQVTSQTLDALGGEAGVELVKSGWEKQITEKGFDKTAEELQALGGAANLDNLAKRYGEYSQEIDPIKKAEAEIVNPEKPKIDNRNEIVCRVIQGENWDNLTEDEQKVLGTESSVELVRAAWEKQSSGKGSFKTAEELRALTGNGGAGAIDGLAADMAKWTEYKGQLAGNDAVRGELNEQKMAIAEKYNESFGEKTEVAESPAAEGENKANFNEKGEIIRDDNSEKFSRYFDLARKINPTDAEKAELNELNEFIKDNRDGYQEWRGGGKKEENNESDIGEFDTGKESDLADDGENEVTELTEEKDEKDESDIGEFDLGETPTEDEKPEEEPENPPKDESEIGEFDLGETPTEDEKPEEEPENPEEPEKPEEPTEPIVEPEIEPENPPIDDEDIRDDGENSNNDKEPQEDDNYEDEEAKPTEPEKKAREERGFWKRIGSALKRFFTESQYKEPTIIIVNEVSGNFYQRIGQVLAGNDLTKFEGYKTYRSHEELQEAVASGEHTYTRVDGNLERTMRAADKMEEEAAQLMEKAEAKRKKAEVQRKTAEELRSQI